MTDVIAKLDDIGKPAWIGLMVLSFILFWPLGLAILAYLIWSGRMGCGRHERFGDWQDRARDKWQRKWEKWERREHRAFPASGNRAFDEYREETWRRLMEEQKEFQAFLDRLRMAKDKAEFDEFMTERRNRPAPPPPTEPGPAAA